MVAAAAPAAVPAVHVVRSGDSLWRIAKRNRMDVATLARLNGMGTGDTLRAGQKLVLNTRAPSSGKSLGVVRQLARRCPTRCAAATRCRASRKVFGVTVSDLVNWNGISKQTTLRPGQKLTVNVRRH